MTWITMRDSMIIQADASARTGTNLKHSAATIQVQVHLQLSFLPLRPGALADNFSKVNLNFFI
jgi:hypothetical protein